MMEPEALLAQSRTTPEFLAGYERRSPLVSVCVATLDRAETLCMRCIPSLLAQSYRNLQIVVVGDHCMDDTERRLAKFGDDRIVFENLPERGPYPRPGRNRWRVAGTNAMNRALALSEGDFIAHLDDDDESSPTRIETLVRRALETRAELLWHRFVIEGRDGSWATRGTPSLQCGQVTTGSLFYHRFFARVPWDVYAYRVGQPGDWNRVERMCLYRPRLSFVEDVLMIHYRERNQPEFRAQENERFLED